MRFHLDDARRHRRVTKALPRLMREAGVDIGHTAAADVAARLFGYVDRHELDACLGRAPASRWDEDEAVSVVTARRSRQIDVLAKAGLAPAAATRLVDALRPTARAGSRRGASEPVAPAPRVPPQAAPTAFIGNVDAILDAWDDRGSIDIPEVFARHVRKAYDEGYERLSVGADTDETTYYALASHYDGFRVVDRGPSHVGERIIAWLGEAGRVHHVRHGDLVIPFEVEKSSALRITGVLRLNKRIPAPPIDAYGIERHDEWLNALTDRPGLHLMCCPKEFWPYLRHGYGRLTESLSVALEGSAVSVRSHQTGTSALKLCQVAAGAARIAAAGRTHVTAPRHLVELFESGASPAHLPAIVDTGSSVLWLASGTPDKVMGRILKGGVPTDWLRRNLLTVAWRTDTPDPHAPSSKLGLDECDSMRWTVEIRRPA